LEVETKREDCMPTSETGTGEKPKPRSLRGILAILGILIGLLVLFGLSKEHQAPKEPGASSVKLTHRSEAGIPSIPVVRAWSAAAAMRTLTHSYLC
jgi:hypothetical protein